MSAAQSKAILGVILLLIIVVAAMVQFSSMGLFARYAGVHEAPPRIIEMATLVDADGAMTLADVLERPGDFTPIAGAEINPGYTPSAQWVRLQLASSVDLPAILALSPSFIDIVDVYVGPRSPAADAGAFTHLALGDHRPLPADAVSGIDNAVEIALVGGTTRDVFIRLKSVNSALALSVSIYPTSEHVMRTTATSLALGGWFGGMAILIAIQLVFFSVDRRASYLLIAASILGAMLVYSGTAGLSRLLLFPDGGVGNDYFTALPVWFGQVATALAAINVLDLRARSRWSYWAVLAGAGVGVIGFGAVFLGYHRDFTPFGSMVMVAQGTILMMQSLRIAIDGGWENRLKAAAYMVLFLGLLITLVQRVGIIPVPIWNGHAYAASNLLHALLLTGAMAARLRASEAMNRQMREDAVVSALLAQKRAEDMVAERTRELEQAKVVAEEALAAEFETQRQQVQFMEVISHQYRTPLAGLRSNVESIGLSLAADDAANQRRLARVRSSIVRLVEVLEVNLARSRLQGPRFQADKAAISLATLVRRAGSRGQDLLNGATICIEIAADAEHVVVHGDDDMLVLAIINLLENGAKFSIGPSPKVVLSCDVLDGNCAITVRDEGLGIPEADLDAIRQSGVRGSNVGEILGTGMGLSLVDRIVAVHGGTMTIESVLGQGTAVRIDLPPQG